MRFFANMILPELARAVPPWVIGWLAFLVAWFAIWRALANLGLHWWYCALWLISGVLLSMLWVWGLSQRVSYVRANNVTG